MKTLTKILLLSLFLFVFVACDDDGYSLNDYRVSMATVENPDNRSSFFLRLDNGDLMWTLASNFRNYRPNDGQRVLANYTLLYDKRATGMYDFDVKLNDVYTVLTKGIFQITPETQDSIGNDSVDIEYIWVGSDYLNVQFVYPAYNRIHFINLVSDTSKVYTDGKIHLEFRHNANGDSPVYYRRGLVSFNLKSLQSDAVSTSLDLVIHANVPYQTSEKTYTLTYKFGETTESFRVPQLKMPIDGQLYLN